MTPEAIAARERRVSEWETKRFNATLKEFIEFKYDTIFEEYCSFYEALVAKHPNKKNLLRTSTFKAWKKHIIEQSFEKEGLIAEVFDLIEPSDSEREESTSEDNVRDRLFADLIEPSEREDSTSEDNVRDRLFADLIEPSQDNVPEQTESPVEDILSAVITESLSGQHSLVDISESSCIQQVQGLFNPILKLIR